MAGVGRSERGEWRQHVENVMSVDAIFCLFMSRQRVGVRPRKCLARPSHVETVHFPWNRTVSWPERLNCQSTGAQSRLKPRLMVCSGSGGTMQAVPHLPRQLYCTENIAFCPVLPLREVEHRNIINAVPVLHRSQLSFSPHPAQSSEGRGSSETTCLPSLEWLEWGQWCTSVHESPHSAASMWP